MCARAHVHTHAHTGAQRTACGQGPPSQRHDQLWIDLWASLLLNILSTLTTPLTNSHSLFFLCFRPFPPCFLSPSHRGLYLLRVWDSLPSYSPVLLQAHPWHPGQRGAQQDPPDNGGHRGNAFFLYRCPMELCSSSRNIENNPHDQRCKRLKINYASACLGLGGRRAGRGDRRAWVPRCTDENILLF